MRSRMNITNFIWESSFVEGRRRVVLRSPLQFRNNVTHTLVIKYGDHISTLGEGSVHFVPLNAYKHLVHFQVGIIEKSIEDVLWTEDLVFNKFAASTMKEPASIPLHTHNGSVAWISLCYVQDTSNQAITISFDHNIMLVNALPITLSYLCNNCDQDVLEDQVCAGASAKINYERKHNSNTYIRVSIGTYGWSAPIYVWKVGDSETITGSFDIPSEDDYEDVLGLSYIVKVEDNGISNIHVYSKMIIIDRTSLHLNFKYTSHDNRQCVKKSYNEKAGSSLIDTLSAISGTSLKKLPNIPIGSSIINNEQFETDRVYELKPLLVDIQVYTDRKIRWKYIPPLLEHTTFISTANNDKDKVGERGKKVGVIKFEVTAPAIVVVYKPQITEFKPSTVTLNGWKYALLVEHLVARGHSDDEKDIFFNGYARFVDAEVGPIEISVESEFGSNIDMHVVVVVPLSKSEFCLNLLSQIFLDAFVLDTSDPLWIARELEIWGGSSTYQHTLLLDSKDGKLSVGVKDYEGIFSSPLDFNRGYGSTALSPFFLSFRDTIFNVPDLYIAYRIMDMPGLFRFTKAITLVPHYVIVNAIPLMSINIRQVNLSYEDASPLLRIDPLGSSIWHPLEGRTEVQISTSTHTEYGSAVVKFDEFGSNVILIPRSTKNKLVPLVLNTNVRLGRETENAYIVVTVSLAVPSAYLDTNDASTSSITIRNETSMSLFFQQTGALDDPNIKEEEYTLHAAPHSTIAFGFISLAPLKPVENAISGEAITEKQGFFNQVNYQQISIGYTTNTSADNITSTLPELPNNIVYFNTRLDLLHVDRRYDVCETAFGIDVHLEAAVDIWSGGKIITITEKERKLQWVANTSSRQNTNLSGNGINVFHHLYIFVFICTY